MKKLLLSSIIMFGVCGFVTAQNATDSKIKKNAEARQSAAAATPQKAANVDQRPVMTNADGTTAAAVNDVVAPDAKTAPTDAEMMKQKEVEKAAAQPAASPKKAKSN